MIQESQVRIVEVDSSSDGQRLDNFLIRELKGVPKSRIYRMIRKGEVRIDKKRGKPETRLAPGAMVRIPPVRSAVRDEIPSPGKRLTATLRGSILEETEKFLVINKPTGLAVHGGSGIKIGLVEALRKIDPGWRNLDLVHRLDRDTSGCLIIAKDAKFTRAINQQLKSKTVKKTYLALVHGYWPDSLQESRVPLAKSVLLSGERMVKADPGGKTCLTNFEVLERFGDVATLIKARPITGRTHQIRVHCQYAGHPIVGDTKYRTANRSDFPVAVRRLCLHALEMTFDSLDGETRHRFVAPLDNTFNEIHNNLKNKYK